MQQKEKHKGKHRGITLKLTVIVEPDDDGFYAYVPALKGLHTCGATEQEALRNAIDAATAYIRSLIKHGDPLPIGPDASVAFKYPAKRARKVFEKKLQLEPT